MAFKRFIIGLAVLVISSFWIHRIEAADGSSAESKRPTIKNIEFDDSCKESLKNLDTIHRASEVGMSLLTWSPLAGIDLSSTSIAGKKFTVTDFDWIDLEGNISGIHGMKKVELLACREVCILEAAAHSNNAQLKKFWNEMDKFYKDLAGKIK